MGDHTENPTYREVCAGNTGQAETAGVVYDPSKKDYELLRTPGSPTGALSYSANKTGSIKKKPCFRRAYFGGRYWN